jgi:hypothetical protein
VCTSIHIFYITSTTAYIADVVPYLLKIHLYSYKPMTIQIQRIGPQDIYLFQQIGIELFHKTEVFQGSSRKSDATEQFTST